jgi:hypothetical protein
MTLNRRDFVASAGWSLLASTAARAHVSWPAATALAKDYFDWATVRAEFDLVILRDAAPVASWQ